MKKEKKAKEKNMAENTEKIKKEEVKTEEVKAEKVKAEKTHKVAEKTLEIIDKVWERIDIQKIVLVVVLAAFVMFVGTKVLEARNTVHYKESISIQAKLVKKEGKKRDVTYTFRENNGQTYTAEGRKKDQLVMGEEYTIYYATRIDGQKTALLTEPNIYQPEETSASERNHDKYKTYRSIAVTVEEKIVTKNVERYLLIDGQGMEYLLPLKGKDLKPGDKTTIYMLYMKDGSRKIQFTKPQ